MSSAVLLGCAVGDALGVPFEKKLSTDPFLIQWDGKSFLGSEHHKLLPCQYSDDTQMSIMVAESLVTNHGFNPEDLAARYVEWIKSGAARGYGTTTLMAIRNLEAGKHWSESGIAGSMGNGTAMRAAPFGIYFRDDIDALVEVCKIDSAITHASDEAEAGSLAIALATAYAIKGDTSDLINKIGQHLPDTKVNSAIYSLNALLDNRVSPQQALQILGTKADVRETVPAALYCFLKFNNYYDAILTAIKAGGDTDTTAAIVGAMCGAKFGLKGIDASFYAVEDFAKLVSLDVKLFNRTNDDLFPTTRVSK